MRGMAALCHRADQYLDLSSIMESRPGNPDHIRPHLVSVAGL